MNTVELPKFAPSSAHLTNDFAFEPLLDSQQAATLLRIHPKTLQRMARNGQITGIQIGKLWRFRASELELWLRKRTAG
jgi:excisionase family DNA binding protein